jgi:hypothetical protein
MTTIRHEQRDGFAMDSARMRRMRLAIASLACCLVVASAQAQQQPPQQGGAALPPAQVEQQPPAEASPPSSRPGFIDALGSFLGGSKEAIDSQVRSTQETLGTIGGHAKDAAGSVVAIPGTRVITGRQVCPLAPNGAPDCQQGVEALCRNRGFQTGRALEVASGHRCSVKSLISGRAKKEAPCPVETYVTRAVCQ